MPRWSTEKATESTVGGSGKRYTSWKNKTSRWTQTRRPTNFLTSVEYLLFTQWGSDTWQTVVPTKAAAVADTATTISIKDCDLVNLYSLLIPSLHLQVFVSHALSYLTASRNGLSDAELEDVLSLDDTVLNDVFQHWLPPLRRLPPLLIPRLVDALERYLVEREANGTTVVYW